MRRNDCLSASVHNSINEILGGIGSVSNQALKLETHDQITSLRNIMTLSGGQRKAQWVAQRIGAYMDFAAKSASTPPKRLSFLPTVFLAAPAAHGCARTIVLSTSTFSMSGSSAKWRNIRSQTLCSHQRANRLYTLFHFPYSGGNKRHCAPLLRTQSTPSIKRRHSVSSPTYTDEQVRRKLSIFNHFLSDSFTVMGNNFALSSSNVNRT